MARSGWKESGMVTFRWPVRLFRLASVAGPARAGADDPGQRQPGPRHRDRQEQSRRAGRHTQKEDFEIYDNGVRAGGRGLRPPDRSAALGRPARRYQRLDGEGPRSTRPTSAAKFLQALAGGRQSPDRVALFSFNYDIQQGGFTRNYAGLERNSRSEMCCRRRDRDFAVRRDLLRFAGAGGPRGTQGDRRDDRWRRYHQLARPATRP